MRIVIIALCLVVLAAPVAADPLRTVQVFGTHFPCNQGHQDLWAINPVGQAIRIKAVTIWMGMDYGYYGDFSAWTYTYNQQRNELRMLYVIGWDRYAHPTTHSSFTQRFAPDWFDLGANEYLRLVTRCDGTGGYGGVGVFIEYSLAP